MTGLLATRRAATRFVVDQNHDINVTPFVDVLLVLLIVFIIAAPLATTAIQVDLAAGNVGAGQDAGARDDQRPRRRLDTVRVSWNDTDQPGPPGR
jgi:biopolymer transport protein ExbD